LYVEKPFQVSPSSEWYRADGVMMREHDTTNYVYMSLRRSNTVTLRKVQNGIITSVGRSGVRRGK